MAQGGVVVGAGKPALLDSGGRLSGRLRPSNSAGGGAGGSGGGGGGGGADTSPRSQKEKRLEAAKHRLLEIDPNAAAEMSARSDQLASLRQRLNAAQAQSCAEGLAASIGGAARTRSSV